MNQLTGICCLLLLAVIYIGNVLLADTNTSAHRRLVMGCGLLFISASKDEQFRAIDKQTGKILWQIQLPAAGYALPCIYSVGDKQYVVFACG